MAVLQKLFTFKSLQHLGIALSIVLLPTVEFQHSVRAAERIYGTYGPLESSVAIESIEKFAKTGEIDSALANYAGELSPQQLAQLRRVLTTKIDFSPVAVAGFLYSPTGETLLRRLGQIIQTPSGLSGFYAIRAALILAAADEQRGFTVLNVLRRFPTSGIRVDLRQSLRIVDELQQLVARTQQAVALIEQQSTTAAPNQPQVNFSRLPDIRQRGTFSWSKQTLSLYDRQRDRAFLVDLYLPKKTGDRRQEGRREAEETRGQLPITNYQLPIQNLKSKIQNFLTPHPLPVIVLSHGLGSDRNTFQYLAQQLASYGFAVAVPEHPNSNAEQLRSLLAGRASDLSQPSEFINRPLDVKYLLDVLAQLNRSDPSFQLNLQQVGVIGHSFGGYTALALAGAEFNFKQLQQDCKNLNDSLNPSLLLQCQALELPRRQYNLRDKRVKAAIAINPITSAVFGQAGLSQIQIPVTIVSSSDDRAAPALAEQIQPFTWLTAKDKYLVLLQGGTHFSATGESNPETDPVPIPASVIGPEPALARRYLQALSVAFFETYVANSQQYRPYLSADYARSISQASLPLSIVQSLPTNQLAQFVQ